MRKVFAALAILAIIAIWIFIIGTLGSQITDQPLWVQLPFYVIAGVAWIVPIRPVLAWMNRPQAR